MMQRRTLHLLAGAAIVILLGVLLGREALQRWQDFHQWRSLAESAAALATAQTPGAEALRQSASSRQIELVSLEAGSDGWLLGGELKDARQLQDWLQQLQREGVQPLRWGLQREAPALRFELVLAR